MNEISLRASITDITNDRVVFEIYDIPSDVWDRIICFDMDLIKMVKINLVYVGEDGQLFKFHKEKEQIQ